jgi:hypothetical protein
MRDRRISVFESPLRLQAKYDRWPVSERTFAVDDLRLAPLQTR